MRILLHTQEYLPTARACAIRMDVFASELRRLGHTVTVISGSGPCPERDVIPAPTIPMRKKTTLRRLLHDLSFAVTSVLSAFAAGKADVVITTSPPPLVSISGWLIARMKGAKLVYDVRDIWPDVALEMGSFTPDSLYCRVFRWIADFMYRRADLVTTVTPGKVAKLRAKLGPELGKKVLLVENGYDLRFDRENRNESAADHWNMKDRFTCVYIGNVGLAQGLESMLEIAARTKHRNASFLIFGTGAEKEKLEAMAREQGLEQVRFCGELPHDQVASVLQQAKISFIPLKNGRMRDSLPTKLYESLAMGCPVLLAAEGDAVDILERSRLGRWASPENAQQLVAEFDSMAEYYEDICRNRKSAMEIIRQKHSRQGAVRELELQLGRLYGGKKESVFT